jgi:streptogramin lyase
MAREGLMDDTGYDFYVDEEAWNDGFKAGFLMAVDEFAEKLKAIVEKDLANPNLMLQCKQCGIWKAKDIDEIADQLKEE